MAVSKNLPIMVVDDYATMQRILRNLLEQNGFKNVTVASSGQEAIQKLEATPNIGLIISDWNMEPMTGLELLKAVRANPNYKGIPFIMVTAEGKTENVIAAKEAGVSNYIVKPFSAETLKTKMTSVLGAF
jgi:two-component system chemotaxis response regulator CheY